jgi:hypothetical protein
MTDGPDRWHRWLLDVRFGGDARYREKDLAEFLYPVRDTVLDKAHLAPGETLRLMQVCHERGGESP